MTAWPRRTQARLKPCHSERSEESLPHPKPMVGAGFHFLTEGQQNLQKQNACNPKVTGARQPSPRTAYERENSVSCSGCKVLSGNFVVMRLAGYWYAISLT